MHFFKDWQAQQKMKTKAYQIRGYLLDNIFTNLHLAGKYFRNSDTLRSINPGTATE